MNTEIVAYSATKAALADLTARYKGIVFDVTTAKGMGEAKVAYKEINDHSIILEKARKNEKDESLTYGRRVDSEAKAIADPLDGLRLPIKAQIETETKREERERAAKVQAEVERLAAEELARKQAEEAKLASERAEIAKQRAELDKASAVQAESDRQARLKIEDEQRASRAAIEAQERASRAKQEEADRAAKAARDAEEARLKADRDKIEAERRAIDDAKRKADAETEAKAKAERESKEAAERKVREDEEDKQREIRRKVNELSDARTMLEMFKKRFGHREEFAGVVAAIDKLLETA